MEITVFRKIEFIYLQTFLSLNTKDILQSPMFMGETILTYYSDPL